MIQENKTLVFDYPILIKENHLDTFGHMNNATYLQIFEEARWQLITERGFGLDKVMKTKQGPVILSVEMQFRREMTNRENGLIRTWAESYKGKIGKVKQVLLNQKGEEACVAVFTFGFFDLKARKLIEPTSEWLYAIGWDKEL